MRKLLVRNWAWRAVFATMMAAHAPPALSLRQAQGHPERSRGASESAAQARVEGLDRVLPPRADGIYQQLAARVDPAVAMDTVRMMAPLWRLAGNPAFEQSQQFVFDRLAAAGLAPRYETFTNSGMGWEQNRGTLRLGGATGEVVLSRETHRVALAIK